MQELLASTSPIRLENNRQSTPITSDDQSSTTQTTQPTEFYSKSNFLQHYHNFSVNSLANTEWKNSPSETVNQEQYTKLFTPATNETCFSTSNSSNSTNIFSTISSANNMKSNQFYHHQQTYQQSSPLSFQLDSYNTYNNLNQSQQRNYYYSNSAETFNSPYLYNQYAYGTNMNSNKYQTLSAYNTAKLESPLVKQEPEHESTTEDETNGEENKKNMINSSNSSASSPNSLLKLNNVTSQSGLSSQQMIYSNQSSSSLISSSSSSFTASPSTKNTSSSPTSPRIDFKTDVKPTSFSSNSLILNQLNSSTSPTCGNASMANLSSNSFGLKPINGLSSSSTPSSSSSSSSSSSMPNSTDSFEWLKPVKSQPNGNYII